MVPPFHKVIDLCEYLQAGLASPSHPDQLVIALEPEAASIYCRRLRMSQLVPDIPPPMQPLTLERNKKLRELPEVLEDYVNDHLSTGNSSNSVMSANIVPTA